ncbi:MAG TPA: aromatic ring-hydroxylating dioxygenase subunit alpha [Deltaproteobacteria bacterium]|nr:aromatic ring-hydroxylating dioxygenase subunit alpha [Candidatus Binatota bacterium]HIL14085.1 aromatic ring-hydroxylating dioxygenase subunit alpha [Deltaproteobacteria bacterium]
MSERIPLPILEGWFCVLASDELEPGSLQALHCFGREMVAFRGEDGQAHVIDAFCPHLGAHLGHGGRIEGNNLRCPFHAWEYDGSGKCVHIPYSKHIPPKARLKSWRVVEKNGLIFVWHQERDDEPGWDIPDVPEWGEEGWTKPDARVFRVRSHPQEMAENVVDSVHFQYVHGTPERPRMKARIDGHVLEASQELTFTTPRGEVKGDVKIRAYGPGFSVTRFSGIIDTLLLITGLPIDDELNQTTIRFVVKELPAGEEATRSVAKAFIDEIERQYSQDVPIWENKRHLAKPILCDGDGPIGLLREFYQQFYPDSWSAHG